MASITVELLERRNICEPVTSVFLRINNDPFDQGFKMEEDLVSFFKGLGRMFYIVNPEDTTFASPELVPKFYRQAWPYFLLFIILENIVTWVENRPKLRLNDQITSLSHGLIQETGRLLFRGAESWCYLYIYDNFRIFDIQWDSPATWYMAAIGVDFCYYWVHRACHEVQILWAQHQVHHSSEDFNMAVGLRQSFFQGWCSFAFYLPLALVIPPAHFITHQQFNLLYQFWIHTETVRNLGPLEWFLNTPNHHRVHHGSNLYCLDKNYGGVLIIWDRIFGTFAQENEKEEIIYGLVVNQPSFNVLHLQTFYTRYAFEKSSSMEGWQDKLKAIFWGPSWLPGRPRLGCDEDKIKVLPREKYEIQLPIWVNFYLLVHFCVVVYGFQILASRYFVLSPLAVTGFVLYIMASLTIIGMIFDNNKNGYILEFFRCLILASFIQNSLPLPIKMFYFLSACFWFLKSVKVLEISAHKQDEHMSEKNT